MNTDTITTSVDGSVTDLATQVESLRAKLATVQQKQSEERNAKRAKLVTSVVDSVRDDILKVIDAKVLKRLTDVGCIGVMVSGNGITPITQPKARSANGRRDLDAEIQGLATPEQMAWLAEEKRLKPRSGGMAHALKLRIVEGDRTVPKDHGRIG